MWRRSSSETVTCICLRTVFTILHSNHWYDGPKLKEQQKLLHRFINRPAKECFKRGTMQVKAFNELKIACKYGWKTDTSAWGGWPRSR